MVLFYSPGRRSVTLFARYAFLVCVVTVLSLVFDVDAHARQRARVDSYLTATRLPAPLEIVILHFLAMSNVKLGVNEDASDNVTEDEQLAMFTQMVGLLKAGYTKPKRAYNGPKITSLTDYIAATRPLRPTTGTVEGDLEYFRKKFAEDPNSLIPYDIDPFADDVEPFANLEVKFAAQRFEDKSTDHLMKSLQKSDSLIGVVSFSLLGWITVGLSQASEAMSFFSNLQSAADFWSWGKGLADIFPADLLNLAVGGQNLPAAVADATQTVQAVLPAAAAAVGATATTPTPAVKPAVGAEPVVAPADGAVTPTATAAADAVPGVAPALSIRERVNVVAERVKKVSKHMGTLEQKLVNFLVELGGTNNARMQLQVIKFFEGQVKKVVDEFSHVGQRVLNTPIVKAQVEKAEGTGSFFELFAVLLDSYPTEVMAKYKKEMIWGFLRADSDSGDLGALSILIDESGPLFKQIIQVVASYVPGALDQLTEILSKQRNNGKKLTPEQFKKIIAEDPNGYAERILEYLFDTMRAGKLYTVVKVKTDDPTNPYKAAKVLNPNAEELIAMDSAIFKKIRPTLLKFILKNPVFAKFGISRETFGQIIDTNVEAIKGETNIPSVVHNQKTVGPKLTRNYVQRIRGKLIAVSFITPNIWDAKPGSRAMFPDWIDGEIELSEFRELYAAELEAIGFSTLRLYHEALLFDPLQQINSGTPGEICGGGNHDLHGGNLMCLKPEETIAGELPFLKEEGIDDSEKVTHVKVALPDYGISSQISAEIVENIILLAAGATTNEIRTITQALWNLQTAQSRAAKKPNGGLLGWFKPSAWREWWNHKENLNIPELEAITEDGFSQKDLEKIVAEKAGQLHKQGLYYSPNQWITYVLNKCHFHPNVLMIDRGLKTVYSFAALATGTDWDGAASFEDNRFYKHLERRYTSDIIQRVKARMGWRPYLAMGRDMVRFKLRRAFKSCGEWISSWGTAKVPDSE